MNNRFEYQQQLNRVTSRNALGLAAMSGNPNLTFEDVLEHPDKPWFSLIFWQKAR